MNKALIIVGALVAFIAVVAGILFVSYVSAYNYGNETENKIKALDSNRQNILAQYSLKVTEAAQVPEMYKNDVKEVFTAAITGRYGADGSKAMWQWLQEKNPQLDSVLYVKIQQIVESGRNKFENEQTLLIDVVRSYSNNLGYFWRGMWMRIAGYPKIDLTQYKPITSEHAQEAFKTGVDKGITIRK